MCGGDDVIARALCHSRSMSCRRDYHGQKVRRNGSAGDVFFFCIARSAVITAYYDHFESGTDWHVWTVKSLDQVLNASNLD